MPHLQYLGQNLPVYSICPDWKTSVRFRTIYSTIIRESLDTSEERLARFPRSLFGIRYQTLPLDGQETGYIRRVMELAQALPIIMPVWTEASKLTAPVLSGATSLPVDDSYPTLLSVLYDYVIVWKDYRTWEVLATDNPGSTVITTLDATVNNYPAGALVMPILIGKLPRMGSRQITDEHGRHQVDFEERFHGLTDQSIVETSLPPFEDFLTYTDACRAEFVLTIPELDEETVYALQITDNPTGDWTPHIYFALMTAEELGTKIKQIVVNNDYGGTPFFRIVRITGFEVMTRPGQVLASVIEPPVISLANLSEITTQEQFDAIEVGTPGATTGLRPLEYYSDGGYVIPYSVIEDPVSATSPHYRRFQKQYGGRQWGLNSPGDLEGILPDTNNPVSVTGPDGATIKWTRDLTDPMLTSPDPLPYNGVANNAFIWHDGFQCVIKARCFSGGCRSPLAMVAVTKVMLERPIFRTSGMSRDAASYCDYPDPTDGSESGLSCNLLYGGICGFEDVNYASGTSGGSVANSSPDEVHGAALQLRGKSVYDGSFLGWFIHGAHSSYYQFGGSTWGHWFNGWFDAPTTAHSWAITNLTPPVIESDVAMTFGGPDVSPDRSAWDVIRDIEISARLPNPPSPGCNVDFAYGLYMDRFDITRSPLYWLEMRDLKWTVPDFSPPPIVDDPLPPPPITIPYESWDIYLDGDRTGDVTMDFREGIDWDGNWDVRDGPALSKGFEFWDYADGAVPDYDPTPEPEYVPYDGGEGWNPDEEWRFSTPLETTVFIERWDGIPDGALPFDTRTTGTGFMTDVTEGWVYGSPISGVEDWSSYADGAFVPANSGTEFIASEDWAESGGTAKFWRVMVTVAYNAVGNHIGIHELELRDAPGGTNWALASNGGIATASSEFSGTYAASKAIDGDVTGLLNGWANNGTSTVGGIGWLKIELAVPKWVNEYKIGHYAVDNTGPSPGSWTFEYSYNGVDWMGQISQPTGQGPYTLGEMKTFTVN